MKPPPRRYTFLIHTRTYAINWDYVILGAEGPGLILQEEGIRLQSPCMIAGKERLFGIFRV